MNVKNLFTIGLCLFVLTPLSWAISSSRVQPFQQYVDYQKFTELSREDQKSMIITLMETMAMMEQELIDADKIYTLDMEKRAQIKKKKTVLLELKKFFETFAAQASILNAYASSEYNAYCPAETVDGLRGKHTTETCMYGSYMSNMVREGNRNYCVRPACSNIAAYRDAHTQAASAGRCSPASMACNPKLYGFAKDSQNRRTKPNCVQLDFVERNVVTQALVNSGDIQEQARVSNDAAQSETFHNISHNVSLACYMEVMNDNAGDERVNQIVESILSDSSAAQEFNNLLSLITNVCICNNVTDARQPSRQDAYVNNFSPSYVSYMQGHRTCNALIAQLELIGNKLTSDTRYCSREELPRNLKSFIESIEPYRALHLRMNRNITDPTSARSRQEAMRRLRNRWVVEEGVSITGGAAVTRVANGRGLDKVDVYERAITAIKSNTQVCPLTFDDPQQFTCSVEIRTAPTPESLAMAARLNVVNNRGGQEVVPTVKWKIGDSDLPASFNGVSLAHTLVPVEGTTDYRLSAEATFTRGVNTNVVQCTPATFRLEQTAPTPDQVTCTLAEGSRLLVPQGETLSFTLPEHTTTPAGVQGTLEWLKDGQPFTATSIAATETSLSLTARFKPATGDAIPCGGATFEKEDEDDQDALPATKCSIKIDKIEGSQAPFKVEATLSLQNSSAENPEEVKEDATTTYKWELNEEEAEGTEEKFEGNSTQKSISLKAIVTNETGSFNCSATGEATETPVTPPTTTACSISVTVAPAGTPGLFSVEASVTPAPDQNETVAFSGMGELKPVEGKKDMARGNIAGIAQAQKKTVKATYKKDNKTLSCEDEVEIPAAQGQAPTGGPQQQPFIPPVESSFLLQKRGVN